MGANGFVGRHLVEYASRQGTEVLGVVRSAPGAAVVESLGGRPVRVDDLGREAAEALMGELAACEGLVYTASVSVGPGSSDRTDPAGLVNVIEACRAAGVPRVIFLSGLGIAHYGMNPHCTNPYFLAKMAGEVALLRSGLATTVFRPSYIFGAGDGFLTPLIGRLAASPVIEIPGDGEYRLQPISISDTVRAILGALDPSDTKAQVVDLVGPEIISYRALIGRIASLLGRPMQIQQRSVREALAQSRHSGYFGLRPHDMACLLCDEVSDPGEVEKLVGAKLEPLDSVLEKTLAPLAAPGASA